MMPGKCQAVQSDICDTAQDKTNGQRNGLQRAKGDLNNSLAWLISRALLLVYRVLEPLSLDDCLMIVVS